MSEEQASASPDDPETGRLERIARGERLNKLKQTGNLAALARGISDADGPAAPKKDHTPGIQLSLAIYSALLGLGLGAGLLGVAYARWTRFIELSGLSEDRVAELNGNPSGLLVWVIGLSLLFLAANVMTVYIVSQRLIGPVRRIQRHIASLKDGDFKARTNLRAHDAFGDVAADLNEMTENLQRKLSGL